MLLICFSRQKKSIKWYIIIGKKLVHYVCFSVTKMFEESNKGKINDFVNGRSSKC